MTKKKLKVLGRRELTESDIELLNEIHAVERTLLELQQKVLSKLQSELEDKKFAAKRVFSRHQGNLEQNALDAFVEAEPMKWAGFAKTEFQKGIMSLRRSIERPVG